ncbi:MAG: DUF5666 domain-containing protein [Chloroflexi bacterium]|nr:DUF5666 domain-containing protein [Chloroflexota bacterium]
MKDRTVERVISTCVDRYLSGEWTLDDCLARYPEHADLVRNYLELSDSLADLTPPPPSKAALSFGERLVLGELDQLVESRRSGSSWRGLADRFGRLLAASRLATATAVVFLALVLGSGATLAASVSSPSSPLYGYKLALDRVRIELAPEDRKADVYIDVAGRRLQEMEHVALSEGGEGLDRISAHYKQMLDHGLQKLQSLSQADAAHVRQRFTESRSNFHIRLEGHRRRLELMAPSGPPQHREIVVAVLKNAETHLSRIPTAPPAVHLQQETTPARVETPPRVPATATPTATLAPTVQPTATPSGTATEGGEDDSSGQTGTTDAAEQQTPQPTETPAPEPTATPAPTPTPLPEAVQIEGVITAMSQSVLEVDGRKIVLDANVVPDPVVLGKPGVGVHVRIRGIPMADGTVVLLELQTLPDKATQTPSPTPTPSQTPTPEPSPTAAPEPDETATPKPEFEISGSITAITDSSIEVDGRTIDIAKLLDTGAVSLESLEVGVMVQVIGYVRPGNVLAAVSLIIHDPETESGGSETETTPTPEASETSTPTVTPPADETQVTIEGVLTAVSEGSVEIDGQTVTIILEGEDATVVEGVIEVGATAVIIASPGENGALVAVSIVIQSGTATPDATPTPDNGDDGQN